MLVFIGSLALNRYRKEPKPINDIDAIATYEAASTFLKAEGCREIYPINQGKTLYGRNDKHIYEIEIAWPGTTAESFLEIVWDDQLEWYRNDITPEHYELTPVRYCPLDMLYTLKMSHRYRKNSPHFLKTMRDIHEMRQMGAQIPEAYKQWYLTRQKETYDYQLPKLDVNKSEFFVDQYMYDHDSLHEAVAMESRPAYLNYALDGQEVMWSREKFLACDDYVKVQGVVEEACVLALERSLIAHPGAMTEDEAFKFALMKVCTSITSGIFREYAWENYHAAVMVYQINYGGDFSLLERLKHGIRMRVVKENPDFVLNNSQVQ